MRSMAPLPSDLRISPIRRAARSLMVTEVVMVFFSAVFFSAVFLARLAPATFHDGLIRADRSRHTQFIWYTAPDIVKCVGKRNQLGDSVLPCRSEWQPLARAMPATPMAAGAGCSMSRPVEPAVRSGGIA